MDALGPGAIAVAAAALAAGAAAQAITGYGFSLVVVPVMVLLVGPIHAVQVVDEVAVGLNVLLLARDHRSVALRYALALLVPALVVTPLAAYAAHRSDPAVLSVIIGSVIVACAVVLLFGRRAARLRGRGGMMIAGAVSAAMNTASGVGGPAVAMYAVNAEWPVGMTSPTLQIYFLGLNLLSLLALGPANLAAPAAVGFAVAIVVGVGIGTIVTRRLGSAAVARAVLVLAVAGGSAAIVRGIVQ